MKKIIYINYILIILILFLNSYINIIFQNIEKYDFYLIKKISIFLLIFLFFSLYLTYLIKNKKIKINIKNILIIFISAIFLKKLYLCFILVSISVLINKKFRLKYFLILSSFFYLLILTLNSFGYLEFNNLFNNIRNFGDFQVFRQTLGFNTPNTAMSLLFPIFALLYYLYYNRYSKQIIIMILFVGKIIFNLTFSRTTFLLIILFICLILIKDKYIKKLKTLFLTEVFFITFFTFYLPTYFRTTKLNELLSWRLWLFNYYLEKYRISFLGNKMVTQFYEKYPLDNTYLRILFEDGILAFILLIILISIIMHILFKNEDYKAIRIFSIVLIYGFMESIALTYYFNIIYFIIPEYIFNKK